MLFLIILVLSFVGSLFLPWWVVAIAAFLGALIVGKKSGQAFLSGFAAVFFLWIILALIKASQMITCWPAVSCKLFPLPDNWIWVLVVTGIIGGLVGGMAALWGVLVKKIFT